MALRTEGAESVLARLAELGFTDGTEVKLIRRAPLGDPLVVRILSYDLCIRAKEAECIDVVVDAPPESLA